jgi:hypothetical protein
MQPAFRDCRRQIQDARSTTDAGLADQLANWSRALLLHASTGHVEAVAALHQERPSHRASQRGCYRRNAEARSSTSAPASRPSQQRGRMSPARLFGRTRRSASPQSDGQAAHRPIEASVRGEFLRRCAAWGSMVRFVCVSAMAFQPCVRDPCGRVCGGRSRAGEAHELPHRAW